MSSKTIHTGFFRMPIYWETICRYKKETELPEWFGKNLSVFWDGLTGMIEVPSIIVFYKRAKDKELLSYIEKLISIAHRAENEDYLEIAVVEKT